MRRSSTSSEPDGALTLRAVSDPYRALVGKLRFDPGEGLAGWVAQHDEPVFLADNALDDPRIKVVPEADEEKYQSFLAVPLRGKADGVLGVIALHAVAPREFSEDDMDFLTYGASLVAGAIENARLYEDTRRRLALVEDMAALARTIAAAATLDELLPEVARRAHGLLEAEACQVFLLGSDDASLRLAGRWPPGAAAAAQLTAPGLAVELARHDGEPAGTRLASLVWPGHRDTVPLVTPLVSGEELLGFLAVRLGRSQAATPEKREVAALIAGQTAVAVQKAQLIDRLTERNAIKDFLEDLSRGSANELAILDRARALGCDLPPTPLCAPGGTADRCGSAVGRGLREPRSLRPLDSSRAPCLTAATPLSADWSAYGPGASTRPSTPCEISTRR